MLKQSHYSERNGFQITRSGERKCLREQKNIVRGNAREDKESRPDKGTRVKA